ncbi:MAG: hypothetical protein CVV02_11640 [Firmicutes bacterium HGW-Firmicutes-7]|nr:MAG: hypothetical protein CVV02_11640 [Firmicutes bacterium HGW-Firmicutes-7]
MMIFIWVLLGFGIYYLLTNRENVNEKINHKTTAEDTLKQRYVHGEIDEETYIKMLKTIRG